MDTAFYFLVRWVLFHLGRLPCACLFIWFSWSLTFSPIKNRWLFHYISWGQSTHRQAEPSQLRNTSRLYLSTTMNFGSRALCTMTVLWKIFKQHQIPTTCNVLGSNSTSCPKRCIMSPATLCRKHGWDNICMLFIEFICRVTMIFLFLYLNSIIVSRYVWAICVVHYICGPPNSYLLLVKIYWCY